MRMIIYIIFLVTLIKPVTGQESRNFDGTGNNVNNPEWGAANSLFINNTSVDYGDDIRSLSGTGRPNARIVSNFVSQQQHITTDELFLTPMTWVFARFIDNEINKTETDKLEPVSVKISSGDQFFYEGDEIKFYRTKEAPGSGTSVSNPRRYLNKASSFIDASNIYGNSEATSRKLRTFTDGKMKVSYDDFLPWNTVTGEFNDQRDTSLIMNNETKSDIKLYYAGNDDVNENPLLIALHTIFLREHNRLCDIYKSQEPLLSDENLFQKARKKLIAYLQSITYNEWLPVQGIKLEKYTGYKSDINPAVSNLFSTISFSLTGTMQPDEYRLLNSDNKELKDKTIYLKDAYYNPSLINLSGGIEPFLLGAIKTNQERFDLRIVDGARNFLYGDPIIDGLDYAVVSIIRSRERGIPSYNMVRKDIGLPAIMDFSELTKNAGLATSLRILYGHVDSLDAWVGLLAEDRDSNSIYGPALKLILKEQFTRIRDGDRFFYLSEYSEEDIKEIEKTRLSDIIKRNSGIKNIQRNVFTTFDQSDDFPELKNANLSAFVYPNPGADMVNVRVWMENESDLIITLFNIEGKKIYTSGQSLLRGNNDLDQIDISAFDPGVYTLLLETDSDFSVVKIIKK